MKSLRKTCFALITILLLFGCENEIEINEVDNFKQNTVLGISKEDLHPVDFERLSSRYNLNDVEFVKIDVDKLLNGATLEYESNNTSFSLEIEQIKTEKTSIEGFEEEFSHLKIKTVIPTSEAIEFEQGSLVVTKNLKVIIGYLKVGEKTISVTTVRDDIYMLQTINDIANEIDDVERLDLYKNSLNLDNENNQIKKVASGSRSEIKLGLILSKQTDKYINISEQFKNFGNQWIVDYYIKYLFSLLARVDLNTQYRSNQTGVYFNVVVYLEDRGIHSRVQDINYAYKYPRRIPDQLDLVHYIAPKGVSYTGVAGGFNGFDSISRETLTFSDYTLAHEIGHCFGMYHDWPADNYKSCLHGTYIFLTFIGQPKIPLLRTIMATPLYRKGYSRVDIFSTPDLNSSTFQFGVDCSSTATTVPDGPANNHSIIAVKGPIIATWK